jgi:hypothetical protein
MPDKIEVFSYINENSYLANKFLHEVIAKKDLRIYNLLLEQIDTIVKKEAVLTNIYNSLIFTKNKIIFEHMLNYIALSKDIKTELERLQFVKDEELEKIIRETENNISKLENDMNELSEIKSLIMLHENDPEILENIRIRMDNMEKSLEKINEKNDTNNYVLSQVNINNLVISEITNLVQRMNVILEDIGEEMKKENELMEFKRMFL